MTATRQQPAAPTTVKRYCSQLANSDLFVHATLHPDGHHTVEADSIQIVLLWECLQQLKQIAARLNCRETMAIPRELRAIKRELATMRKERAK